MLLTANAANAVTTDDVHALAAQLVSRPRARASKSEEIPLSAFGLFSADEDASDTLVS